MTDHGERERERERQRERERERERDTHTHRKTERASVLREIKCKKKERNKVSRV